MTIRHVNQFSNHSRKPLSYYPISKKISRPRLNYTINVSTTPTITDLSKRINPPIAPPSSRLSNTSIIKMEMGAEQAMLGPLVLSGSDVIKDLSGHIRKGFDSSRIIYGTEHPIALTALGFTSGFSLISGGLSVKGGMADAKRAKKISDATGRSLAYLKIAKGGMQVTAGGLFVPARALTIAALATSSEVYAITAGVLGSMAGNCVSIVALLVMASISLCLHEQRLFRQQLFAILNDPSLTEDKRYLRAYEHLKQLTTISPQEKAEISQAIASNEKYRSLTPEQIAEKTAKKEEKLLRKKETYLKRLTSFNCLSQVRLKGSDEAKNVVEIVKKQSRERVILASIAQGLIATGVALTVSSFFLGPTGLVITSVMNLATSFSWMVVHGFALIKNYQASDPGRYDKLWIFVSTTIAVTSVSLVFFFSAGIAPIVAASVVGAGWLGINSLCYYRIHQFEQKALLY